MSTKDPENYLEPEYRPDEEWLDPIPRFEKRGERSEEVTHVKGFVIVLADTLHDEDVDQVISALMLIKGVIRVEPVSDKGYDEQINRERIRYEMRQRLLKALEND